MFKNIITTFGNTWVYKDFIKNMPYPFSDLYFVFAVIIITGMLICVCIYQAIRRKVVRKKIKRRQEEARINRLREAKEEKNERREIMQIMRESAENGVKDKKDDEEYRSTHDTQTGLLNKLAFNKAIKTLNIDDLLVVYVDINDLKKTNDQYGKVYGDRLIKAVSRELNENFMDKCYRTGGDEFIVLINGMSEKIAKRKIDKIKSDLEALTQSDEEGIVYSAAFGIAVSDGLTTKQDLIKLSEERMKEDKLAEKSKIRNKYGDDGYVDVRIADLSNEEETNEVNLDILTGCMTKEVFEEHIRTINETNLSIITADIDGLKYINDKLSHHDGDTVIKGFSKVLRKFFKGCVYRLSDDDFCIMTNKESRESLLKKVDLIKTEMIKMTSDADNGIFYSASFGISTNADDGDMLIDGMLDECLIKMREDKEEYRSGKRAGVVISSDNTHKDNDNDSSARDDLYDVEGIIAEKRGEIEDEADNSEENALTSILYSMKAKEEENELEAEKEENYKRIKQRNEELLNEEIKSKFNKEDLTNNKKGVSHKKTEAEKAIKDELLKISQDESKKKGGLFSKRRLDSDEFQENIV